MSLGFYFDGTRCVGCKACQIACKDRFDLQRAGARPRRVTTFECGKYPDPGLFHINVACNHCENPACVANCPTGSMVKVEDGTVQHIDETCIGCRICAASCPYEAPQFDGEGAVAVKCDSCKALRDAGMNPVCVDACAMRALDFGELDELAGKYGPDLVSELPCLPGSEVTGPNLLVRAKDVAFAEDYRKVML